jgi:hypothetical protein
MLKAYSPEYQNLEKMLHDLLWSSLPEGEKLKLGNELKNNKHLHVVKIMNDISSLLPYVKTGDEWIELGIDYDGFITLFNEPPRSVHYVLRFCDYPRSDTLNSQINIIRKITEERFGMERWIKYGKE